MNDYWKNKPRNYPISLKVYHDRGKCSSGNEQECIEFGYCFFVEELLSIDYEYTLSAKSVSTFNHFCKELYDTGFTDEEELAVWFDYIEIQSAFQELLSYINSYNDQSMDNNRITHLVNFLKKHYYCPCNFGQKISLQQYLHQAGFSQKSQKKLFAEHKFTINGSADINNRTKVAIDKDKVKVNSHLIPWKCRNGILVSKRWGW